MNSFLSLDGSPLRSMFRPDTKSLRRLLLTTAVTWAIGPVSSLTAQFAAPTTYFGGPGTVPVALAFGDMTAGSNPDMVTANAGPLVPSYYDWWKNGNQTSCPVFGSPPFVPAPAGPLAFGDLGALDIAVAEIDNAALEEVVTLEPTAFGASYQIRVRSGLLATVQNPLPLLCSSNAIQMLVEDFDGDGDNDVLVLDATGSLIVYDNLAGVLQPAVLIPLVPPGPGSTVRFAAGSFDGDQLPDLVVLWGGVTPFLPAQAHVLRNTSTAGTYSFAFPTACNFVLGTNWSPGLAAVDITTGDFNGDGCDDFVVGGGWTGGGPTLWFCTVDRTAPGWPGVLTVPAPVALPNVLTIGEKPVAITSGDFDLDGDLDLAYTTTNWELHIRPGTGNGSFSLTEQVFAGCGGFDIAACDTDGDGDLDLATCDTVTSHVHCNLAPVGRCHHVMRAGIDDGYVVAGLPLVETTCARTALGAGPRMFDVVLAASSLGHTFEGLPDHIVAARLYLGLCPDVANGNLTDTLHLDFGPTGPELDFAFTAPVPFHTVAGELCLDLAQLPSCLNLLPRLGKAHRLDVTVGTNTKVDYLRLELTTACPDHDLVLKYNPALGVDTYYHTPLVAGLTTTFSIDAGLLYASGIAVIGMGPAVGCVNFESLCLFLTDIPFVVLLDTLGRASVSVPIPTSLPPCLHLHTQAVAFDPTFTWTAAKWSDTISDYSHQ